MADIRLRPRFRRVVRCPARVVLVSLRDAMERPDGEIRGRVFDTSALVKLPESEIRFWSPQLQLSVEQDETGSTVVHGIFGPHPTVWSSFVALYVAAGFIGSMGLLFASAQWMLDRPMTALWAVPGALLLGAAGYVIARTGRLLGAQQTGVLYDFVDRTLDSLADPSTVEAQQ